MKKFIRLSVLLFFVNISSFAGTGPSNPDSTNSEGAPLNNEVNNGLPLGIKGVKTTEESKYKRWTKLKYSGYIRSYNQFRHMPVGYATAPEVNSITLNGLDIRNGGTVVTGYQEPLFLLRLEGAPTSKTFFKLEYAFDHQMSGIIKENTASLGTGTGATSTRRASAYRILEFTGKANTKIGNFRLLAGGGVMWYRLSPFTYWNYEYRDDMFERFPWEPEGNPWGRYNRFYADQNLSRDARWGNTGTQGFILDGNINPLGINFAAIYGKTDNSGGFQTYLSRTPKNVVAGKVEKIIGKHKFGINYFNQFGFSDAKMHRLYYDADSLHLGVSPEMDPGVFPDTLLTTMFRTRQQIITADGRINFPGVRIYTEIGAGRYQDSLIHEFNGHNDSLNTYLANQIGLTKSGKYFVNGLNYDWGHAINLQVEFDKSLTRVPFSIQFFSISKSVVNVNSAVLNSANPHALADLANVGQANDITTFQGAVTELANGQMTNNRWGLRLRHEDSYGKLKVMAALDMQQEHENLFNTVSYQHQLNAFTRSRFGYFQQFVGPYRRIVNIFRRSFEKVDITDSVIDYKKGYNSVAISLKYKFLFLDKELILSNFNSYNSVQDHLTPIPVFSDDAFIRAFYEEFMAFYAIHPRLSLIGMVGIERNIGNKRTELVDSEGDLIRDPNTGEEIYAENGRPLNQFGYGYGVGFDYDLTGRAGLFFRHRWFNYQDVNHTKDRFYGYETTIELKIFF